MPHKLGAAVDSGFVPTESRVADYGLVAGLFEALRELDAAFKSAGLQENKVHRVQAGRVVFTLPSARVKSASAEFVI
jgi:hypothetical protein